MNKILNILVVLGIGLFLSGCDYLYPGYTINYKVTVEIETLNGVKTGSSVHKLKVWRNIVGVLPDANNLIYEVVGEATVVNLGNDAIILALPNHFRFMDAFSIKGSSNQILSQFKSLNTGMKKKINFEDFSMILFLDKENPRSISTLSSKNIQKQLGSEVKVKSITITTTDEPVTWGQVEINLPWIYTKKISLGKWNPDHPDPANYMNNSSFIKGKPK